MLVKSSINWFALVSGVLMIVVVGLSFFTPWWQLKIGSNLVTINADPFYTNFGALGLNFVIPILFAINIGATALFVISGALLILYSVQPLKSYGKELLCYGYKRPIYTLISFVVFLTLTVYAVPAVINTVSGGQVDLASPIFPLIGTSTVQLPTGMFSGSSAAQVGVSVVTAFQYTFYLAVVATALAIVARLYHKRIVKSQVPITPETPIVQTP